MKTLKFAIVFILTFITLTSCNKSAEEPKKDITTKNKTEVQKEVENFAPQTIDDLMSKNITNFLTLSYLKDDLQFLSESDRKFQMYIIDLDGDGKDEYFVRFLSSYFCGSGGCTILLLDRYAEVITKFTVMQPPLYVSDYKVKGWRTLMIESEGKYREMVYNGKKYPSNPSLLPESKTKPESNFEVLFDDVKLPAKTYTY